MADILHWLSYLCLFFSFHPRRSKKDDIFNFRLSNGDLVDFGMTIFHFFNVSSPQAHTSLSAIFSFGASIWTSYSEISPVLWIPRLTFSSFMITFGCMTQLFLTAVINLCYISRPKMRYVSI